MDEIDDMPTMEDAVIDQLYYSFVNLTQNTKYYISVTPVTDNFEGMPSDITHSTLPSIPVPPTDVVLEMDMTDPDNSQLTISWIDENSDEYSVQHYMVVASCNNELFNETTQDTSVTINVGPLSGNIWCTGRVQAVNQIGAGDYSFWGQEVFPLMSPPAPMCFLTEELGNMAVISFTLSTPYALNNLNLEYSLTSSPPDPANINVPNRKFNGNNSLPFTGFSRNVEYTFRLRLCEGDASLPNNQCSNQCMLTFFPSQVGG